MRVLLPGPFEDGLDYYFPFDHKPRLFDRVLVPLGKRKVIGFIYKLNTQTSIDQSKIKAIIKVIDTSPWLSQDSQNLMRWLIEYYHCRPFQALRLFIPKLAFAKEEIKTPRSTQSFCYSLNQKNTIKLAKNAFKQKHLVDLLKQKKHLKHQELGEYNIHLSTVKRLLELNIVQQTSANENNTSNTTQQPTPLALNPSQQHVFEQIQTKNGFNTSLIFGVTGSGKTEVYLELIKPLVQNHKQVLILVPEINLTPQISQRFKQRFPDKNIETLHSRLSDHERYTLWLAAKNTNVDILISTRTGIFFDLPKLTMIIIDEEHDASFKQQSHIQYNARDVATVKAKQLNIPIILGSGTPSIESYHHALNGKYQLFELKQRALNNLTNDFQIINLQDHHSSCGISNPLKKAINLCLNKGRQALLFINRRGFAHSLICQDCGWCATCHSCDKPFTLHQHPQHLACHFCHKAHTIIQQCPQCHSTELTDIGSGTEKIQGNIATTFPNARLIRLDKSTVQKKGELEHKLQLINSQKVDIIIGTQMISKGHDFQHIGLVGVINIDTGFYSQDFHAIENIAQLLTQVAGRAGRGKERGKVLIQTYQPDNPIFDYIIQNNYRGFLDKTLQTRQLLNYPPFYFQAYIYAQSLKKNKAIEALTYIFNEIKAINTKQQLHCELLAPIPALHEKVNGQYRYVLMISANKRQKIQHLTSYIQPKIRMIEKSIRISIDIDPIDIK